MTRRMLSAAGALSIVAASGCAVTVPRGEAYYAPPAVVVEHPAYNWRWFPPRYEVEHHYVIENEHVNIRDNHYYPFYNQANRYVKNDKGKHKGWFKHED